MSEEDAGRSSTFQEASSLQTGQEISQSEPYRSALVDSNIFVTRFRSGEISKTVAIREINSRLTDALGADNPQLETALELFVEVLDNHTFQQAQAVKRVRSQGSESVR